MNKTEKERLAVIETKIDHITERVDEIKQYYDKEIEKVEKIERLVIQNDQLLKNHVKGEVQALSWSRKRTVAVVSAISGIIVWALDRLWTMVKT